MYNSIANPQAAMSEPKITPPVKTNTDGKANSTAPADFFTLRHIPRKKKDSSIPEVPSISLKVLQTSLETAANTPLRPILTPRRCNRRQKENKAENLAVNGLQFKEPRPKGRLKSNCNRSKLDSTLSQGSSDSTSVFQLGQLRSELLSLLSGQEHVQTVANDLQEQYEVLYKLGEGSFSKVYCVKSQDTGSLYAMKVISQEVMQEGMDKVTQQIRIHSSLDHPNISKLYKVIHQEEQLVLLQQFAGKNTLYDLMKQRKQFTPRQTSQILSQVCEAIKYMHGREIMHRDIKPQNIIISEDDTAKMIDFGWSVECSCTEMRRSLCGTPLYLSPELISGQQYDKSVDLWALGVIAYEMLTGESPFGIESIAQLNNIVTEKPRLEVISDPLAHSFIRMLLAKKLSDRKGIEEVCLHPFLQQGRPVSHSKSEC